MEAMEVAEVTVMEVADEVTVMEVHIHYGPPYYSRRSDAEQKKT